MNYLHPNLSYVVLNPLYSALEQLNLKTFYEFKPAKTYQLFGVSHFGVGLGSGSDFITLACSIVEGGNSTGS